MALRSEPDDCRLTLSIDFSDRDQSTFDQIQPSALIALSKDDAPRPVCPANDFAIEQIYVVARQSLPFGPGKYARIQAGP